MKILYLSDYYNSRTSQPLNMIAEIMDKKGHDVSVYTSTADVDPLRYDDSRSPVQIARFRTIRFCGKCFFPGIIKFAFQKSPDILHAYVFGFFSTTVASYLKKIKRYKLVVTADVNVEEPEPGLLKKPYIFLTRKIPASCADVIITYTGEQKKNLIEKLGIDPAKIKVVPIGIHWKRLQAGGRGLKRCLGLGGSFVVVNASNISPVKNLEMIINAIGMLKGRNIKFVHIGGVLDEKYKVALDNLINRLGIRDKVLFIGNIPNKKISQYYGIADIYFQSSHRESYCIPILEAMAAGKPVVTTHVGIAKELGKSIGFLVRNEKEAAKAIMQLYGNRKKAKAIGKNNRKIAKKYDWSNIIARLEKIYEDLVRG